MGDNERAQHQVRGGARAWWASDYRYREQTPERTVPLISAEQEQDAGPSSWATTSQSQPSTDEDQLDAGLPASVDSGLATYASFLDTDLLEEEPIADDDHADDGSYIGGRDPEEIAKNCTILRRLHVPGKPVFVLNVHDTLTASIAAEQAACQALCVDLQTLTRLVPRADANAADFFFRQPFRLIQDVARIAQRSGKLLTVDMDVTTAADLVAVMPALLALGVVGFDVRDAHDKAGFLGADKVAFRVEAVVRAAKDWGAPDFVVNVAMDWPGHPDAAVDRANYYLEHGAAAVTVLRRLPDDDIGADAVWYITSNVRGSVGFLLQAPTGGKTKWVTAKQVARTGVARLSHGNQWPYVIRGVLNNIMEMQTNS